MKLTESLTSPKTLAWGVLLLAIAPQIARCADGNRAEILQVCETSERACPPNQSRILTNCKMEGQTPTCQVKLQLKGGPPGVSLPDVFSMMAMAEKAVDEAGIGTEVVTNIKRLQFDPPLKASDFSVSTWEALTGKNPTVEAWATVTGTSLEIPESAPGPVRGNVEE